MFDEGVFLVKDKDQTSTCSNFIQIGNSHSFTETVIPSILFTNALVTKALTNSS
jgi:hypothetical protein